MHPLILTKDRLDLEYRQFDIFWPRSQYREGPGRKRAYVRRPLLVQSHRAGYRLLYGFSEIENLEKSVQSSIPAYLIPAEAGILERLELLAEYHLQERDFEPIEASRLLQVALSEGVSEETCVRRILPALNLSPSESLFHHYRELANVPPGIQTFLIAKRAPLKTWQGVAHFTRQEQQQLEDTILKLKPTLSIFTEIVRNLFEIAQRERRSIDEIMGDLQEILKKAAKADDHRPVLRELRDILTRRRYPKISRHRDKIQHLAKAIKLPGNASLEWDPGFERKLLQLIWRLSEKGDLEACRRFAASQEFEQLEQLLDAL